VQHFICGLQQGFGITGQGGGGHGLQHLQLEALQGLKHAQLGIGLHPQLGTLHGSQQRSQEQWCLCL
jgi:hypothetical protein